MAEEELRVRSMGRTAPARGTLAAGLAAFRGKGLAAKLVVPVTLIFLGFSLLLGVWITLAVRGIYLAEARGRAEVMAKAALSYLDNEWKRSAFAVTNPVVQRRFGPLFQGSNVDAVTRAMRELKESAGATFIHAYGADGAFLTSSEDVTSAVEPPFLSELTATLAKKEGRFTYLPLARAALEFEGLPAPPNAPATVLAAAAVVPLKDDFGDSVGSFLVVRVLSGDHAFAKEIAASLGGEVTFALDGTAVATSVVGPDRKPAAGYRVPTEVDVDALIEVAGTDLQGHYHRLGDSPAAGLWTGIPVSGLLQKARGLTLQVQAAGLAAVAAFGALVAVVTRRSLRHVAPLLAHMEDVSRGHLRRVPTVHTGDEIETLAQGLDRTVEALQGLVGQAQTSFGRVRAVGDDLVATAEALAEGNRREVEALSTLEGTAEALGGVVGAVRAEAAASTGAAQQNLATLRGQLGSLRTLADGAGSVLGAADQTQAALAEMSLGQNEVSQSLASLTGRLTESAAATQEIDEAVAEIRDLTGAARDLAGQLSQEASEKGQGAMERVGDELGRTGALVSTLVASVESLGQRSVEIGEIIDIISGVTSQSKLLALNASILAAQAGEHGRAFGVVADNMRALSESTNNSARTIVRLIEGMQEESRRAVTETARGVQALERSNLEVDNLRSALSSIVAGAHETSELVERMAAFAEGQSAASSRVASSIAWVASTAQQVSAVVEQQTESGQHILNLAQDTRRRATEMKRLADEQAEELGLMALTLEEAAQGAARLLASAGSTDDAARTLRDAISVIGRAVDEGRARVAAVKTSVAHLGSEANRVTESLSAFELG